LNAFVIVSSTIIAPQKPVIILRSTKNTNHEIFTFLILGLLLTTTEMKTNKYNYLKVIQQNYGQGFEDVSEYETDSKGSPKEFVDNIEIRPHVIKKRLNESLLIHDLKEYRLMGYPTRVIFRREPNI